mmetsp:Transcript_13786/g.33365  ORF Transcript_13786/g.33365 Transcript_13786/m.33365 type:complete len:96 (+) Transcript_13786:205-492(+)
MVNPRLCEECAHQKIEFCVFLQQLVGLIAGVWVISVCNISKPNEITTKLMPIRCSSVILDKRSSSSIFANVDDARVAHKSVVMCGNNNVQQYDLQ